MAWTKADAKVEKYGDVLISEDKDGKPKSITLGLGSKRRTITIPRRIKFTLVKGGHGRLRIDDLSNGLTMRKWEMAQLYKFIGRVLRETK